MSRPNRKEAVSFDLTKAQLALARQLAMRLRSKQPTTGGDLVAAMHAISGYSLASGLWSVRHAYDAGEAAQVLWVLEQGADLAAGPSALQTMEALSLATASQTKRSQDQVDYQQFSTPLAVAYLACMALGPTIQDVVLEPSAGTGCLASFIQASNARLVLNELETSRRNLLARLFPSARLFGYDAANIHAHLHEAAVPITGAVLNPPFSRSGGAHDDRHAAARHVHAVLQALPQNGRCVAILPSSFSRKGERAKDLDWLGESATPAFNLLLPPRIYARHGTGILVRLIVFDRVSSTAGRELTCTSLRDALALIDKELPARPSNRSEKPSMTAPPAATLNTLKPSRVRPQAPAQPSPTHRETQPITYTALTEAPPAMPGAGVYQPYRISRIHIDDAQQHPSPLVESLALAAVVPPLPAYTPLLPRHLVTEGILSDAQLEAIVYAGEAHSRYLPGSYTLDPTSHRPKLMHDGAPGTFQYRCGYMIGDGTGVGKGREAAAIILDNWSRGRTKAAWLSLSGTLLEDAQRDWAALGGIPADVVPLHHFKLGQPITLSQGILFATYATLRVQARGRKLSRVEQIIDWLGQDFDGVILLDEAHAMANAAGSVTPRSVQSGSAQGQAGLDLQNRLPHARVVYVSATDSTEIHHLSYAPRLGLWGHHKAPFLTREEFCTAMENGGIAAAELVARELKAKGLKTARCLSFEGVEYEILQHQLTAEQIATYDAYAAAFQIIHTNLEKALRETRAIDPLEPSRRNGQAVAAAKSAFESVKQRFFGSLLTGMACPALIAQIKKDVADGNAAVVQLVATGQAILERRLASLSADERDYLDIDLTPREAVITYLEHAFPTQMMAVSQDEKGNYIAIPLYENGNPVHCPQALRRRQTMIEELGLLPPIPSGLDQLIAAFGPERVAEITGRSKRIVIGPDGCQRLQRRSSTVNLAETQAFMQDQKQILVFSEAGGTGRSYHADPNCPNQRRRIHSLLEAGWNAAKAIQGFGRTHRTAQVTPPRYRMIQTNVKAQRRFLSTIARRLDKLGALTRGHRETGSQGLFQAEDNLESQYAIETLIDWYHRLVKGQVQAISLEDFQVATGLTLVDKHSTLLAELPPIQRWLNRLLAMPVALQNRIFEEFDDMLAARVLKAQQNGTYDVGIEDFTADRIVLVSEETILIDEETGAETCLVELELRCRQQFNDQDHLLKRAGNCPVFLMNAETGTAAVRLDAPSRYDTANGLPEKRYCLVQPRSQLYITASDLAESAWRTVAEQEFLAAWEGEIKAHQNDEFTARVFLLTGLVLALWKHIQDANPKVRRAVTEDGRTWLGPAIDAGTAFALKQRLGIAATQPLTPDQVWTLVMDHGQTLTATQGVNYKRAKVLGVPRLEIVGVPPDHSELLRSYGLAIEIHQFRTRLFVPSIDERGDALSRLLKLYPLHLEAATV